MRLFLFATAFAAAVTAVSAGVMQCHAYKYDRRLSNPVRMDIVETKGSKSTYKNIMVHGSIFAAGDVVAKVHTHINASTAHRAPNSYDVVLNTKSTKASFMAIVTAYPVYAGNAGVPEKEPASYWINDHDTCKFSVGGIAFDSMEVQAVFK